MFAIFNGFILTYIIYDSSGAQAYKDRMDSTLVRSAALHFWGAGSAACMQKRRRAVVLLVLLPTPPRGPAAVSTAARSKCSRSGGCRRRCGRASWITWQPSIRGGA